MTQGIQLTAVVVSVGVIGGVCAYRVYCSQKARIPTQWTRVGTLKDISIYPVKSCRPVRVEKAECSVLGLRVGWLRDRILMVVNSKYNFISARAYPELLRIQPSVQNSILTLKCDGMEDHDVDLAEVAALQQPTSATVWGVTVPVYDCGWVCEWLSRLINHSSTDYRLVHYASEKGRTINSNSNEIYKYRVNDKGALPDEVPYSLINEASVLDLNSRLTDSRVTPQHFRPNFLLKGGIPYDEDNWRFVKIGDNVFEIIKPCHRCILTTIDPETGIRHPEAEPLIALKKYRQENNPKARRTAGNAPRMGVQMALRSGPGGVVSLNDDIYVA